jgi:FemAB-related protein (PEP-CTERM system-associated)
VAASSDEVADALIERACQIAEALRVEDLELRNRTRHRSDWPEKDLYVTFRKPITADQDANMKAIPRKQRAMVRKGIDAGLVGELDLGIDRLYAIYSESVRNLGTPVFARRYFRILREVFADDCEVVMVRHDGQDIAGVMSFYFREEVLPYYGGSVAAARELKGNDFMYWDLMCKASQRGARLFDYGRSKIGTGPYSFKKNWGFEPSHRQRCAEGGSYESQIPPLHRVVEAPSFTRRKRGRPDSRPQPGLNSR